MSSNRVFNVNGHGIVMLREALRLAFIQCVTGAQTKCRAYQIEPEKGMILLERDAEKNAIKFPAPMDWEATSTVVWNWLESKPETLFGRDDRDHDGDGTNKLGWRTYLEHGWGVIAIVRPSWLYYAK